MRQLSSTVGLRRRRNLRLQRIDQRRHRQFGQLDRDQPALEPTRIGVA
jgi:hypothetical protein